MSSKDLKNILIMFCVFIYATLEEGTISDPKNSKVRHIFDRILD